jgi:hypothetical protein
MSNRHLSFAAASLTVAWIALVGCSNSDSSGKGWPFGNDDSAAVGAAETGGRWYTGGAKSTGGTVYSYGGKGGYPATTGGYRATGGAQTGGYRATGGAATGGYRATGGAQTGGYRATGGSLTGGYSATGGYRATGGYSNPTGGYRATGGSPTGGYRATGASLTGGYSATGGSTYLATTIATGGAGASGGTGFGGVTAVAGGSTSGGSTSGGSTSGGSTSGGSTSGGSTSGGATASGGSTASGGTAATGGSTATTVAHCPGVTLPTTNGNLTVTNGYVQSTSFHGYAYSFIPNTGVGDSCIVPDCGASTSTCSPSFGATALCAAGKVAPQPGPGLAGFGFALNQEMSSNTLGSMAAPSTVTVSATLGEGAGDAIAVLVIVGDDNEYYCVEPGAWATGLPIDISYFNTACQVRTATTAKALSVGAPIRSINVFVTSDTEVERPFSICMTNVTFTYNAVHH